MATPIQQPGWNPDNRILNPGAIVAPLLPGSQLVKPSVLVTGGVQPAAPVNLSAVGVVSFIGVPTPVYQVTLAWGLVNPKGVVIEIQRMVAGGSFAAIGYVLGAANNYTDNIVDVGSYSYRVRALSTGGYSAFSNTAGPVDGGCVMPARTQAGLSRFLIAPASGSGAFGINLASTVQDSYDDATNGVKTLLQFVNPLSVNQAAAAGPTGTGVGWYLGSIADTAHKTASGFATITSGSAAVWARVRYVIAPFVDSSIRYDNIGSLTLSSYIDELQLVSCGNNGSSSFSGLNPLIGPLFPISVGAPIYGVLLDCKLKSSGTVSGGQAFVLAQGVSLQGLIFFRALFGH